MKEFKNRKIKPNEVRDENGRLLSVHWYTVDDHRLHRVDGPAVEEFDPATGNKTSEIWINIFQHGKHRDNNLPSDLCIDPDTGVVTIEEYYRNSRLHRDDGGPAEIYRDAETGFIVSEVHRWEGLRDRADDLPAVVEYDPSSGQLVREEYYQDDLLHRAAGPAIIEYNNDGQIIPASVKYFYHGQKVSRNPAPEP